MSKLLPPAALRGACRGGDAPRPVSYSVYFAVYARYVRYGQVRSYICPICTEGNQSTTTANIVACRDLTGSCVLTGEEQETKTN